MQAFDSQNKLEENCGLKELTFAKDNNTPCSVNLHVENNVAESQNKASKFFFFFNFYYALPIAVSLI